MANGQIIAPILTDASNVEDFGPGGVLNQLPGLKAVGDIQRKSLTVINEYKDTDKYSALHPNALSDEDNQGRGVNNNQVGTLVDRLTKQTLVYSSGNKYKPGMGYYNRNFPEQYW